MMRNRLAWMLYLLLMSLTAWPMPAQSTMPLTPEQIVSAIDPGMWYQGSDVRAALLQVITIGQEEIRRTAEEAVKTAVAPLLADKAQLTTERDGYKAAFEVDQARLLPWQIAGVGGGVLSLILALLLAIK